MKGMQVLEADCAARELSVAVVAARFNDFIVSSLIRGAERAWEKHGGRPEGLLVARVPGAFELPAAASHFAATGRYAAVVALGCVIRGDTAHFDYVAGECAHGLMQAALDSRVPIAFGVLTVENVEQAIERAALRAGDKGGEAMETALEMANLFRWA